MTKTKIEEEETVEIGNVTKALRYMFHPGRGVFKHIGPDLT